MKIRFICDCELEIVTGLTPNGDPIETQEVFREGDETEFDLIDHPEHMVKGTFVPNESMWNVQFGDGSMGMGIGREWFEIIS